MLDKTLKVIEPFFTLSVGDELELNKAGDSYVAEQSEEYNNHSEDRSRSAHFSSVFTISKEYAEDLIKQGYLQEKHATTSQDFVNVFDEIDRLITQYETMLNEAKNDHDEHPAVVHEAVTVYNNLIKVLNHLKSLKK